MAAWVLWPTALISYPHLVFQIKNQTKNSEAIANKKVRFKGEYRIFIPKTPDKASKLGSQISSGSLTVWGAIWFVSRITSTNK